MNTPRILHVVGSMNRGGAETMLMSLYRVLDREKLQFDFLEFSEGESDYAEEIAKMGGRILKFEWSQSPLRIMRTISDLGHLISEEGPYVAVHSHVLFASGTVLLASYKAGVPVRISHSHNTNDIDKRRVARIYHSLSRGIMGRFSTALAACTEDAGIYLFGRRHFHEKGSIIPNAVDTEKFCPPPLMGENRPYGFPSKESDSLVLISVARLEPVKNHQFLIQVADILESMDINFNMYFIGEGSLREELENMANSRNLNHRVHFLGIREDVASLMRHSDMFLMPSLFEGLPVALVEAQATGLACIISENITKEVDMGLGIVKHLPITSPRGWAESIVEYQGDRPSTEDVRVCLDNKGYTMSGALKKLLTLYPVNAER